MIVQTISIVVFPWIGGPSLRSSGLDPEIDHRVDENRGDDREDEQPDHVVNQKTNSIRPASREAGVGSHGTKIATRSRSRRHETDQTSWRIEPRRTAPNPTRLSQTACGRTVKSCALVVSIVT